MDEVILITNIALLMLLAGVCSIIFHRLKMPPLVGYLVSGIIIANTIELDDTGTAAVELLSDLGLILLMFSLGLEVNLKKLRGDGKGGKSPGRTAIIVGAIQLPLMVVGGMIGGWIAGFDTLQSVALGALISGSSTAVVLAVLHSEKKLSKEQIDLIILVTIIEDIGQVVMLSLLTPALAGSSVEVLKLIIMIISIAVFVAVCLFITIKKYFKRIMDFVSDNYSFEVLLIVAIGFAFGMACLANYIGLSVAIGAFFMGMIINPARKSEAIFEAIKPMKDLFMAMFFISVGMEIQINSLINNILMIIGIYLLYLFLKSSTVYLGYWIADEDSKTGFFSALSLVAMGEFAFIISKEALDYGVVDESFYASVIGAALVSMVMLPVLSRSTEKIWDRMIVPFCKIEWVGAIIEDLNGFKENFYGSGNITRSIRKELNHAYFDLLIIIVLEIIFTGAIPEAGQMLASSFGGDLRLWYFVLVALNFVVIYFPIRLLIGSLSVFDSMLSNSSKQTINLGVMRKDSPISIKDLNRLYETVFRLYSNSFALIIDIAIIIIAPYPLGLTEYGIIFAAGVILVLIVYLRHRLSKRTEQGEPVPVFSFRRRKRIPDPEII
ncbi:MAG: cation:proton antiporter [Candidatus Methanomethylophilaceae archaeon]|nr:cation:proton antiporter [Candidatus Methanomethylophilaceae archaeon]